jgi:hypothetical protein
MTGMAYDHVRTSAAMAPEGEALAGLVERVGSRAQNGELSQEVEQGAAEHAPSSGQASPSRTPANPAEARRRSVLA